MRARAAFDPPTSRVEWRGANLEWRVLAFETRSHFQVHYFSLVQRKYTC
jgi:hypothetical protein